MSVNGVDKSSISRMTGLSWTTIERWLETAALYAQNFNEQYLKGYDIKEVQVDEIRTFVDSKKNVQWLFTAIEVSSRLWISMVVGKRNYQNVKRSLCQFLTNGRVSVPFLFTTDGLDMVRWFVQRYLKGLAIYGQIIKKRGASFIKCCWKLDSALENQVEPSLTFRHPMCCITHGMNHKNSLKNLVCPNENCPHFRKHRQGDIIRHSFYKTRQGRRRRYRRKNCGRTFSSTYGTAYYRLQSSRSCFDEVATMSVNGIGKSAISRIKTFILEYSGQMASSSLISMPSCSIPRSLQGYEIVELQADEIRTFVGSKKKVRWVFTALEVSSRLWVGLTVGSRTYKNVKRCLLDVLQRGRIYDRFLLHHRWI